MTLCRLVYIALFVAATGTALGQSRSNFDAYSSYGEGYDPDPYLSSRYYDLNDYESLKRTVNTLSDGPNPHDTYSRILDIGNRREYYYAPGQSNNRYGDGYISAEEIQHRRHECVWNCQSYPSYDFNENVCICKGDDSYSPGFQANPAPTWPSTSTNRGISARSPTYTWPSSSTSWPSPQSNPAPSWPSTSTSWPSPQSNPAPSWPSTSTSWQVSESNSGQDCQAVDVTAIGHGLKLPCDSFCKTIGVARLKGVCRGTQCTCEPMSEYYTPTYQTNNFQQYSNQY